MRLCITQTPQEERPLVRHLVWEAEMGSQVPTPSTLMKDQKPLSRAHSPAPPLAFPRQAVGEEGSPAVCLSACFQKSPLLGGEGTLILLSPPMLPGKSIQPLFSPKLPSSSPSLCPVPSRGTTSG